MMFKRFVFIIFSVFLFISCGKSTLYKITDEYVNSLYTTHNRYALNSAPTYTHDKLYKVQPIGRLINVRIEKDATDKEYEDLAKDLMKYYEGNDRVHDIYICRAGTIMIDCRY